MKNTIFTENDLKQIELLGLSEEKILNQIQTIQKPINPLNLVKPCTINDGIIRFNEEELQDFEMIFENESKKLKCIKFVPASGAATRMFKNLISALNNNECNQDLNEFIKNIDKFAFYDDLKNKLVENGYDINKLLNEKNYIPILETLLNKTGLNYSKIPKALIKFHKVNNSMNRNFNNEIASVVSRPRNDSHCEELALKRSNLTRTPIEEHINDSKHYASSVHFTISPDLEPEFKKYINSNVTYSIQKKSTDVIALDLNNNPFRDKFNNLVFRPSGHGALLENLNNLASMFDIIFVRNIDNVVSDKYKSDTFKYKCAMAGYLITIQNQIFDYLKKLDLENIDDYLINVILKFCKDNLFLNIDFDSKPIEVKIKHLKSVLNKPLRICGVVKNRNEVGGLPFWVKDTDDSLSMQFVEQSQIDNSDLNVLELVKNSTHFNPVFMVLGVKDYNNKPFNLNKYANQNGGIISIKSYEGKNLKAYELPGLWNGGMYYWNSIFVEIPHSTFCPVKNFLDLLNEEHQEF